MFLLVLAGKAAAIYLATSYPHVKVMRPPCLYYTLARSRMEILGYVLVTKSRCFAHFLRKTWGSGKENEVARLCLVMQLISCDPVAVSNALSICGVNFTARYSPFVGYGFILTQTCVENVKLPPALCETTYGTIQENNLYGGSNACVFAGAPFR